MRNLRLLLAGLVAAAGLLLVAPAPAQACSCVTADPQQFTRWADVIFTGTLLERTPPPERELMSSGDPATHLFEVDEVYKGEVGSKAEVLSAVSGASCGLEGMQEGTRYVVFAGNQNIEGEPTDAWWASLCGGTAPASDSYVASVADVTGPGRAPEQTTGAPLATGAAIADPASQQAAREDEGLPVWLWSGGVLVLVVSGGLLAVRRLRGPAPA